jgi:peroxiredoxin Q/BCP
MHPKVGDSAPDFRGKTTDGAEMSLADFRGKKLVLYFYSMDFSPACTMQACSLRDHGQEIRAKGAEILGVSTQRAASHQRFGQTYKLSFPLLADTNMAIARAYGAIGGGLFGGIKAAMGVVDRVTFIIDEQGKIAHIIDSPNIVNHGDQVLALL